MSGGRSGGVALLFVLAFAASSSWAVPGLISFQGYIEGAQGSPIDGTVEMQFAIYAEAEGGDPLWQEAQSVRVENGIYHLLIGASSPLSPDIFEASELWLDISVDGFSLSPRKAIASVPFALRAGTADAVAPGAVGAAQIGEPCGIGQTLVRTAEGWACGSPGCVPGDTFNCYSGAPATRNVGACREGIRLCSEAGQFSNVCSGEVLPQVDVCGDGQDNDCDGLVDCDDGKACTADSCDGQGGCTHSPAPGYCIINGQCYADRATNPANSCQECRVAVSQTAWAYKVAGSTCSDGFSCTVDVCNGSGTCTGTIAAGSCLIGGTCYDDGALNPANPCQKCAASVSRTSWYNLPNGTSCGAGQICYSGVCTQ